MNLTVYTKKDVNCLKAQKFLIVWKIWEESSIKSSRKMNRNKYMVTSVQTTITLQWNFISAKLNLKPLLLLSFNSINFSAHVKRKKKSLFHAGCWEYTYYVKLQIAFFLTKGYNTIFSTSAPTPSFTSFRSPVHLLNM